MSTASVEGQNYDFDWLISVDDHIIEPPHVFERWLPKKFRDRGPRVVDAGGVEAWEVEGKRTPTVGLNAVAGRKFDEYSPNLVSYADMRPGCYDPAARAQDMDEAGIIASLCFPSYPRFCGQLFAEMADRDLGLACLKAYNDFILQEWCGTVQGRFIPMTLIPLWDPQLAVKEMQRCAEAGSRAIAFSENPAPLGFPSLYDPSGYWDPVFRFAEEADLPICMHICSSSRVPMPSEDAPFMAMLSFQQTATMATLVNWIFSGTLERFPRLKICLSEGGIGWIAPLLERAEQVWTKQRHWATKGDLNLHAPLDEMKVEELRVRTLSLESRSPTQQFKDQVYGCFIDDAVGVTTLHELGAMSNVMIETDYPHSDTSWPNSISLASKQLEALPDHERWAVLQGNARRIFKFEPALAPARTG